MSATTAKEVSVGDMGARGAEAAREFKGERMALNVGPSHPTTHGVLRLMMELDGDVITKCEPVVGYLHRGDEKIAENMTYNQFVPYTDRLDYIAPLANNVAYVLAVEKLAGVKVPERCRAIRVLVCEMARISSHLLGMGVFGMDAGAWTPFMYTFTEREKLYTLFEDLTGARVTTSYTRIGGVARDVPDGWLGRVSKFCDQLPKAVEEVEKLLTRNRIFLDRTEGLGVISKEDALAWGITGPNLRATGVDLDLRKDKPYSGYEQYDFDVPIGTTGDCYDRYLVRIHEMRQSLRILEQCIEQMPGGSCRVNDRKISPPPRAEMKGSMEALILHFKLFTEGYHVPAGETYAAVEAPKGEFAVYLISDGTNKPYRCKIRAPGFAHLQAIDFLSKGHMLADVVANIGSIDIVFGEIDR